MKEVIDVPATITDVATVDLKVEPIRHAQVITNILEVKKYVSSTIVKYQNYIVTEENLKDADADLKVLNKVSKELDDQRKKIKKEMETPIKEMETEFKGVIALISPVSNQIKDQILVFEEQRKEAKRFEVNELIKPLYEGLDMKFIALFIFDEKWLNKTKKETEIINEATLQIKNLKAKQNTYVNDLKAISSQVDAVNKSLDIVIDLNKYLLRYEATEDLASILVEINEDAEFNRKQYEDLQQKAVANAAAQEEPQNDSFASTLLAKTSQEDIDVAVSGHVHAEDSNQTKWAITFKATGEFDNMKKLNKIMKQLNIEVEVLNREELK